MKKLNKKDYNMLLSWATNEIKEYQKFIKEIKKQYEKSKKSKKG